MRPIHHLTTRLVRGAAGLLLSASAVALLAGLPTPTAAETATFFDSIFEGRERFDQRVAEAGGTLNIDLLSGLTSRVTSWARSGYSIASGNGDTRSVSSSRFSSISGPGGSFASGDGIRMSATSEDSQGSGLVFTFDSPVNAFALELEGWATCCFPSALYISFDGGTPILVGSAQAESDNPGEARYNQSLTFVALINDSATFTTVAFYGAADGDSMYGGGTIRYAVVPIGGLSGEQVIDGSQPAFTESDRAIQGATVTFRGGTFRPTGATALAQNVVVEGTNGIIDTSQGPVVLLGTITGDGQFQLIGGGRLTFSGEAANAGGVDAQSGTVVVDGLFRGPVLVGPDGTLTGGGIIGGATTISGILSPGASPGTLTFTAPVTLNAGAVTRLEIDGTGTGSGAGSHDRVLVTGAGNTLTAGGSLQPVLRGITGAANNDFTPALGQTFRVIQAEGGLLGSFAGLEQPASGLPAGARFDALYGPNSLDLVATPSSYGNLAPLGIGQRGNQVAAGTAVDAIRPAAGVRMTGDAADVFGALYTLPGAAIPAALDQISGVVHAQALAATLEHRRILGAGIGHRLAAIRAGDPALTTAQAALAPRVALDTARSVQMTAAPGAGIAPEWDGVPAGDGGGDGAGDGAFAGWSLWGRALGATGSVRGDGNAPGYERQSGGALVGADRRLAPGLTAGIALGFLRGTVDGDESTGEVRLDTYQASLYGVYMPPSQAAMKPFLDATLGTGLSRYDSRRDIAFGSLARRANGDSDGTDLTAEAGFGFTTTLQGIDLEPRAFLRWDRISRGGFTETGAGALDLSVDGQTADALRAGIGLRASRGFTLGDGLRLQPELRLGYARELQDGLDAGTHRLGGAAFRVESPRGGRDVLTGGIGLTAFRGDRFAVMVDYDGARSERGTDHVLTLGLRLVW
ncbi:MULTISPECIES: autotransporter family protein [Roseomonadaceae]|uniref:Autotransporter outer membrane beta-barrel domain-containing protein n=1 Tax=Falsiroseomonas oleicola TaxID=2801474 RepID=A0ABS6H9A1_9PROT|nr:autotransporter outer membrane beta-barrel domain-containing protein [Roseomonas oleicola]MBU8545297.1 autotransporter outer membrane beta-barrel domain-containing protein [Roseomonas oleicola]